MKERRKALQLCLVCSESLGERGSCIGSSHDGKIWIEYAVMFSLFLSSPPHRRFSKKLCRSYRSFSKTLCRSCTPLGFYVGCRVGSVFCVDRLVGSVPFTSHVGCLVGCLLGPGVGHLASVVGSVSAILSALLWGFMSAVVSAPCFVSAVLSAPCLLRLMSAVWSAVFLVLASAILCRPSCRLRACYVSCRLSSRFSWPLVSAVNPSTHAPIDPSIPRRMVGILPLAAQYSDVTPFPPRILPWISCCFFGRSNFFLRVCKNLFNP